MELPFGLPLTSGDDDREEGDDDGKEPVSFETVPYGDHPLQRLEIMSTPSCRASGENKVVFFCHGGAWGSGKPFMYRNVAQPFLEQNYTVVMWGYRTYPTVLDVQGQVDDLCQALDHVADTMKSPRITVMGHSTGGHVALLTLLNNPHYAIDGIVSNVISLSAVYDIPSHYVHETSRGVEEISPLQPICGGSEKAWRTVSPVHLARQRQRSKEQGLQLPRCLVVHGAQDTVVPCTQAYDFAGAYEDATFALLPDAGHVCTVMDLMLGGATQTCVLDWLERQEEEAA